MEEKDRIKKRVAKSINPALAARFFVFKGKKKGGRRIYLCMVANEEPISVAKVAIKVGVSKSFLYDHEELLTLIKTHQVAGKQVLSGAEKLKKFSKNQKRIRRLCWHHFIRLWLRLNIRSGEGRWNYNFNYRFIKCMIPWYSKAS